MQIVCNIITSEVRELASKIGHSEIYTCNLISLWQSKQTDQAKKVSYPTEQELNTFIEANKNEALEAYFAIPVYTHVTYNSEEVPIMHDSKGNVVLQKFPSVNPLEHFFGKYNHLPELKNLIASTREAYMFILWREMAFIQRGLDKTKSNRAIAEGDALTKLKKYREKYPVQVIDTGAVRRPSPINIYAGTNENADLSNFAKRPFTFRIPGYEYFSDLHENSHFFCVEQAFQMMKFDSILSTELPEDRRNAVLEHMDKIMAARTAAEIKHLGRDFRLTPEEVAAWDAKSSDVMKQLIKASFEQNPAAMQRLIATGNAPFAHTQDNTKWRTEFPRILKEVREEVKPQKGVAGTQSNTASSESSLIEATIAPYYFTSYDEYLSMPKKEQEKMRTAFKTAAQSIAGALGLTLDMSQASANIGGYSFNDGNSSVIEPSFTFRFKDADPNKVRLFSALMGDLGYQAQEAVVTSWDIPREEAYQDDDAATKTVVRITDIDRAIKALAEVGIKNFTLDKQNKTIKVLSYDNEDVRRLSIFVERFKDLVDGEAEQITFKSFYDGRADREDLYRQWLENSQGDPSEGQLRDFIQAALKTSIEGSVTSQLIDHLIDQDFNVFGKNEMRNFLRERGIERAQRFIGKKSRAAFESYLRKARPDMSDEDIKEALDFLHTLEDNKENTAYIKTAIRWIANNSIKLPWDHIKAKQAFAEARSRHIDISKYSTLGALISSEEMKPKEKEKSSFDPDKAKTFSGKRTVTTAGGKVFTVYDVEDSAEGQREVCKAIAAHYVSSPWCLSTFTATGEPTESAKKYWNQYNAFPRRIAYFEGRPVAFNSDSPGKIPTHTIEGVMINTEPSETGLNLVTILGKADSSNYEDEKFSIPTIIADLIEKGLVKRSSLGLFLTKEGRSRIESYSGSTLERWWDLDDKQAQNSLSDSIATEASLNLTTSEEARLEALYNRPFEEGTPEYEYRIGRAMQTYGVSRKIADMYADFDGFIEPENLIDIRHSQEDIPQEVMSQEEYEREMAALDLPWFIGTERDSTPPIIQAEMDAIKERAIADGTFMKAPNGKPTNLTERQWLQVRTRAFKEWFGDWEKGLRIEQDNKSYYRGQYEEPIIDKDGNLILKGRKDSLYERAGYNIEKGVSATTDMQSANEYGTNKRYAYEADVEEKYGELDQSWEKEQELNEIAEHGYYLIQFPKDISNQIINENGEVKIVGDVVIPKGQYIIEHISDDGGELIATADNNASKVVDENGEPLVVNRSDETNFTIFDRNKIGSNMFSSYGKGFYFADYDGTSDIYGGTERKFFLNIRDYDSYNYDSTNISENISGDGRIINFPNKKHEYIVINPNQIKSATDNVGTFSTESNDIQFFTTDNGEVYGFVDDNDNIYLDREIINPEHPIHEYTHIWDKIVSKKNPALWNRGIALMKQTSIWREISEDPNYGAKWAAAGISEDELEYKIASEVHARLVGKEGKDILDRLAKEKGSRGIIAKLKEWLAEVWRALGATFGTWSTEELNKLTLEDFNQMTLRDFVQGSLKSASSAETPSNPTPSGGSNNGGLAPREAVEVIKRRIDEWDRYQREHITFDKDSHKYFFDGNPIDYSVTQYFETIFGPKDIQEDHSYATAIGNSIDAITRDFFLGKDVTNIDYPNLNKERKALIIDDLKRLNAQFRRPISEGGFGKNCQVITKEDLRIAARIKTSEGEKTIAGTMDMLIIDENGDVHIFDMKAKRNSIDDFNDRRDYTAQLNAYRQILETILPELKGKIKDLRLIWFAQSYPRQGEVTYSTNANEEITVTDRGTQIAMANYSRWETPRLQPMVTDSLIPLRIETSLDGTVEPVQKEWSIKAQDTAQTLRALGGELVHLAPTPTRITSEEASNTNNFPGIGIQNTAIDYTNPRVRIVRDFTIQQRTDYTDAIARRFSEKISKLIGQKISEIGKKINEELAKPNPNQELIASLNAELWRYTEPVKGRRNALEEVGGVNAVIKSIQKDIQDLIDKGESELDKKYGKGRGAYLIKAYGKILDNFEVLVEDAMTNLESRENFRIVTKTQTYNNGVSTQIEQGGDLTETTTQQTTDEENYDDDPEGKRANGNDGWSFKVRFVDPHKTLSYNTKSVISKIIDLDESGRPKKNDLGDFKYMNEEFVHAVLINELSQMITADDFCIKNEDGTYSLPALEKLAVKYPWVQQIIKAIEDNPAVISSFYTDFRKEFIPYWLHVTDKEGTVKTICVNRSNAEEATLTRAQQNVELGQVLDEDSVYTASGAVNPDNAQVGIDTSDDALALLQSFDEDDFRNILDNCSKVFRMLGFPADNNIMTSLLQDENGRSKLWSAIEYAKEIFSGLNNVPEGVSLTDYFADKYREIASRIGLVTELDFISSFRQGDQTYYSYSAPSNTDILVKMLKSEDSRRKQYLNDQFRMDGSNWWFVDDDGNWRNEMLRLLDEDENVRSHFRTKELLQIDGKDYSEWDPDIIRHGFLREYFYVGINPGSKTQFANYNFPIFSDSETAKFFTFVRYITDGEGTFKQKLTPLLANVIRQELVRIKKVRERKAAGIREITNFDKNGDKFHFFPVLNDLLIDGVPFIDKCEEARDSTDPKALDALINTAVNIAMQKNFEKFLRDIAGDEGIVNVLVSTGAVSENATEEQIHEVLEEYYWNNAFAQSQIIQVTTTDLAFYKNNNGVDFQKRYKQSLASGSRLNTNSKYGRKIERTIYLRDKIMTSTVFQTIRRTLDQAVSEGLIKEYDRDNILYKLKNINASDGQAYRSLSSMRSVLDMMGLWDEETMNPALENFAKGKWNMRDFNLMWQTLKPFVFATLRKPDGLGGAMRVPHQNKNSEFLLLAMYEIVANSMGKSGVMRALNKFMEDKEVDVVQFESAVKEGGQGIIDITYHPGRLAAWLESSTVAEQVKDTAYKLILKKSDSIEKAKESYNKLLQENPMELVKMGYDELLSTEKISQEQYNQFFESIEPTYEETLKMLEEATLEKDGKTFKPEVVHEIPYDSYMIAQPTPEHLKDVTNAVFGSQLGNLITADLPNEMVLTINGKPYTKSAAVTLYQEICTENLLEDYFKLKGSLDTIENVQKALLKQVKGNPKYGRDMLDALQIVEIEGKDGKKKPVFNIPLDNPSTTASLQEIMLAMFKNRITKQTLPGGNAILVSSFGYTDKLKVRYDESTGAIIGVECLLPAYSRQFYEPFMVEKTDSEGNKYMELDIEKCPEDLRKLIGYRIPTESKYSMLPLIVVGFLPESNGSAVMYPAEALLWSGEDFDVDKKFLFRYHFRVDTHDKKKAKRYYEEKVTNKKEGDTFDKWWDSASTEIKDQFKYDKPKVRKIKYNPELRPEENKREQRDNMIIDICWAILTSPEMAAHIANPGSFDNLKLGARVNDIVENPIILEAFIKKFVLKQNIKASDLNKINYSTATGVIEEGYTPGTENGDTAPDWVFDPDSGQFVDRTSTQTTFNPATGEFVDQSATNTTEPIGPVMSAENVEKAKKILLRMMEERDLDTLNDFVSEFTPKRDPLSLSTFVHFHTQNMAGAALIGVYANNTTAQAKLQNKGISLTVPFTMDGKTFSSLTGVISPNGDLISKECSEFSNASVDNAKDPVLASLMQNLKTARITCLMLRAGLSINQISLLWGVQKLRGYKFDDDCQKYSIDKIASIEYTSDKLMNILTKRNIAEDLSTEERESLRKDLKDVYALMDYLALQANDLGTLTQTSRADSPNGAVDRSIAGAKLQIETVKRFNAHSKSKFARLSGAADIIQTDLINKGNGTKESLREAILRSRVPRLQAYFTLGIEGAFDTLGEYFAQANPYVDKFADKLLDTTVTIVPKTLNDFYRNIVTFALTKTKLFGDDGTYTYDQKKAYYLEEFPKKLKAALVEHPQLAKIGFISKLSIEDDITFKRSGRLTSTQRDILMRDLDMMLFGDDPILQQVALDLFAYSFYKDGNFFGPNSMGRFFSSNFIASIPEYIEVLRTLRDAMYEGSYLDGYYEQYIRMNPVLAPMPNFSKESYISENTGQLVAKRSDVKSHVSGKVYEYVAIPREYSIDLFKLSVEGPGTCVYDPIKTIISGLNANKTAEEIANDDDKFRVNQDMSDSDSTNTPSAPSTETADDWLRDADDNPTLGFIPSRSAGEDDFPMYIDKYSEEEGEAQLDEKLC